MPIRQNRLQKTQKQCFSSQNCGSIPEWNYLEINITAAWFNSRMEFCIPFIQVRLPKVFESVFAILSQGEIGVQVIR